MVQSQFRCKHNRQTNTEFKVIIYAKEGDEEGKCFQIIMEYMGFNFDFKNTY